LNQQVAIPVHIPLINPNEREAALVSIYVNEGQHITKGERLFTLETTKSTNDVQAEMEGYVVCLSLSEGQIVDVGDIFCYLAESPDWKPTESQPLKKGISRIASTSNDLPQGLRITQPALSLAQQYQIDLYQLPVGPLVTKEMVETRLAEPIPEFTLPTNDLLAIVIYGGGGHGKSLIDFVRVLGIYHIIGVIDDGFPVGAQVLGYPILGGSHVLPEVHARGVHLAINAIGGIDSVKKRIDAFNKLAIAGFTCPAVVHPTAFVEASAILEQGVQVFPHAYVGSDVSIGFGSIINTGATVSHDCLLGKYVNLSPGATLAGQVHIGDGVLLGMLATVNIHVNIGARARIGNGATVKSDIPEGGIVHAGCIWPK
jgi:acetyltransferase EpsM